MKLNQHSLWFYPLPTAESGKVPNNPSADTVVVAESIQRGEKVTMHSGVKLFCVKHFGKLMVENILKENNPKKKVVDAFQGCVE